MAVKDQIWALIPPLPKYFDDGPHPLVVLAICFLPVVLATVDTFGIKGRQDIAAVALQHADAHWATLCLTVGSYTHCRAISQSATNTESLSCSNCPSWE